MLPGLTSCYICPQCHSSLQQFTPANDFYPFAPKYNSNGYGKYHSYSLSQEMGRCTHCLEMFWLRHLSEVKHLGIGISSFFQTSAKLKDLPYDAVPVQAPRLPPKNHHSKFRVDINGNIHEDHKIQCDLSSLRLKDIQVAIQSQFWETVEDEFFLRWKFWSWVGSSLNPSRYLISDYERLAYPSEDLKQKLNPNLYEDFFPKSFVSMNEHIATQHAAMFEETSPEVYYRNSEKMLQITFEDFLLRPGLRAEILRSMGHFEEAYNEIWKHRIQINQNWFLRFQIECVLRNSIVFWMKDPI